MGVRWNQNKENYNVTTTCGKRAARLEGTCGDATGRLAACDFLERPRQSSTITSSSNFHHIWYATTTYHNVQPWQGLARGTSGVVITGTFWYTAFVDVLQPSLYDSFLFFLILYMLHSVHFCSFLFHTKPWFVDLVDQLPSAAHDSSALAMVLAENRHLNFVDFTSSCQGLKSWRHQEGTPRASKFTCHIHIHHIIHLHPEEVPKYSKPVAADSKPCCAK